MIKNTCSGFLPARYMAFSWDGAYGVEMGKLVGWVVRIRSKGLACRSINVDRSQGHYAQSRHPPSIHTL